MGDISKNKRLAKNSIYLYIRMLFAVCINLYTSRLVLEYLGVEEFGVYNVVGGVVALMMFVNTAMSGATSRFISFSLGKNNLQELKATISSAIQVHIFIAFLLLLVGATLGFWFVHNELNIPEASMNAVTWVYLFSLLTSVIAILQVPFNASVVSYERMDVFAIIEIANVVLKCVIVFSLVLFPNRLIAYSGLLFAVSVMICLAYVIYCVYRLEDFGYTFKFHKSLVKEMTMFAACDLFGNGTFAVRQQGVNILINKFFGVAYNAAGGVATQASGIISTFMNNVLSAFRPQIIKEYSAGNIQRMSKLMYSECEILILLAGLIFVPLYINMDFIMQLWLKNVPPYAVVFCKILLICNVVSVVKIVITDGIYAAGNIKNYSIYVGSLNLVNLLLVYIFFMMGLDATYAYYTMLLCIVLQTFVSSYILNRLVSEMDMNRYLIYMIKPFLIVGLSFAISELSIAYAPNHWLRLFISLLCNTVAIIGMAFMVYPNYRMMTLSYIKKISNK